MFLLKRNFRPEKNSTQYHKNTYGGTAKKLDWMKLILTDYIASLREEEELDKLLEDVLREYDFEIIYGPQKGVRQYGVDIYAIGPILKTIKERFFL